MPKSGPPGGPRSGTAKSAVCDHFLGATCITLVGLALPKNAFFARRERRAMGERPLHLSLTALERPTGFRRHFGPADLGLSSASLGVLATSSSCKVAALDTEPCRGSLDAACSTQRGVSIITRALYKQLYTSAVNAEVVRGHGKGRAPVCPHTISHIRVHSSRHTLCFLPILRLLSRVAWRKVPA